MASKQKFAKLNLGPAGAKVSRRSAILGGKVVADYVSPDDNQRYVVVECSQAATKQPKQMKIRTPKEPEASHAQS